jgi:phosphoglycolate phosphatase
MQRPSLVVFDFDGTLAETREAVSTTLNAALHAHRLPRVTPPSIHSLMGLPLEQLISRLIPRPCKPYDTSVLVDWYRANFAALGEPLVTPMHDATAALTTLKEAGVAVAIATSRESTSLDPILARFGWTDFVSVATCDRVEVGKPAPDLLQLALREADADPADAVLVGDTTWDIEMARAAGVHSVGIPRGSHKPERLAGAEPDWFLDSLQELVERLIKSEPVPADGGRNAPPAEGP